MKTITIQLSDEQVTRLETCKESYLGVVAAEMPLTAWCRSMLLAGLAEFEQHVKERALAIRIPGESVSDVKAQMEQAAEKRWGTRKGGK